MEKIKIIFKLRELIKIITALSGVNLLLEDKNRVVWESVSEDMCFAVEEIENIPGHEGVKTLDFTVDKVYYLRDILKKEFELTRLDEIYTIYQKFNDEIYKIEEQKVR